MKKTVLLLLTFGLTQAMFCQKTIRQQLDELMDAYCKVNKFNGAVLVSQKGKILLEKGYGLKDAQRKTMNDANSIFQIYSVTKTFTSTVILKLIELNKLSLADTLGKFYPGFTNGDSITIENLLTHTAGIYDGDNIPSQTETSLVTFLKTKPLDFSPGTQWSYSNSGYRLLGYIIQKITGISYENAVQRFIFDPLKMTHSGFDFKYLLDKNKTTGYEIFGDEIKKEAVIYAPPGPFAAGAIYSTVGDLYKYHKGLQAFKIVTKATLKRAYTAFKNNYGYGWMIRSYEGMDIVSHSGGAAGYRSNFVRIPKEDICIILLNNTENANVEHISKNLVNVLINKPYKVPSEIKLGKAVLAKYVGCYAVNPTFTMYITMDNGRLAVQATGQGKAAVFAQKENYFFADEADGFLEFPKDENGAYNELIIHQGGQDINAKRFYPAWGLIGSATAKGWEGNAPDITLTEDSLKKGLWLLNNIQLLTGELKFRFNNDWNINYGDNENDKILDLNGENIKIEAGMYNIILDLTDETKPKYSVSRKD